MLFKMRNVRYSPILYNCDKHSEKKDCNCNTKLLTYPLGGPGSLARGAVRKAGGPRFPSWYANFDC